MKAFRTLSKLEKAFVILMLWASVSAVFYTTQVVETLTRTECEVGR